MENQWLQAALWTGLALIATILSLRIAISIALPEIMVGVIGGNFLPLQRTEWVNFLAGFGSILLTFLAGAEVETIINYARDGEFDLLVIGFMGHSKIFGRVWGSTSQNLAKLAPCTVVVVK